MKCVLENKENGRIATGKRVMPSKGKVRTAKPVPIFLLTTKIRKIDLVKTSQSIGF